MSYLLVIGLVPKKLCRIELQGQANAKQMINPWLIWYITEANPSTMPIDSQTDLTNYKLKQKFLILMSCWIQTIEKIKSTTSFQTLIKF